MGRYTPPPVEGAPYTPPFRDTQAPTPIGTPQPAIPPWMEPPLPSPPAVSSGALTVTSRRLSGRNGYLVGAGRRFPILYGRLQIVPDLILARQDSIGGRKRGYFVGVVSEGRISGIKEWFSLHGTESELVPGTSLGASPASYPGGYYHEIVERTGALDQTVVDPAVGRLPGVSYVVATSGFYHAIYPCFIAEGRLLFDPRLGAWGAGEYADEASCAFSANPALEILDLLTHPQYGRRVPPSRIDWASFTAGANRCDEIVDGIKRYECHIYIREKRTAWEWIETIGLHAGGMRPREVDGMWVLDTGEEPTVVDATITGDHIVAGTRPRVSYGGGAGFADLPNSFVAEWTDSAAPRWPKRQLVINHPEVDAGAEVRPSVTYQLDGCLKEKQAYRCLWAIAHRAWSDVTISGMDLKAEMLHLKDGSLVTLKVPALGFADSDFVVTETTYTGAGIRVGLRLHDPTIWTPGTPGAGALPDDGFFDTPSDLAGVEWLPRTVQRQIPLDDGTIAEQSATGLEIRFNPLTNPYAARILVRYRQAHETGAEGITSVLVVDGGLGYTNGSAVTVTGSAGGSGFAATITTDGAGTITGVTISDPGSGYDPADPGLALSVAGGSTQAATLRPAFDAVVADIWDDPTAIEIPFPPTGNAPSVGGKNVIQLPLSVGPWPEPLYAASDLLLDFDERTIGGPTTWSVALRVQSVPALLSSGLAVQGGPADPWSTTVIDYPVVRRELASLTANRLPKWNGDRLADSKLSDDGTTPRYDGNAIYHEGNPPPAGDTFPAGAIVAYGGSAAPDGWLLCDGSAVSRTTYADLFAVLGTTHGAGDGSTTFNLPDLRDRFVRGKGGSSAIGDTGGAATHLHAVGLSVGTSGTNARETGDTLAQDASPVSGHLTVDHYHSSTVAGDTATESSLPPYLVEVWIIKASGTPSAATPHNTLASRDAAGAHPASAISFTPAGSISATTVQAAIEEVAAEAAGGGSPLTVKEDDGAPSVASVAELRFLGATVEEVSAGVARVTVTGGGGATPNPAELLYAHATLGGF